jgi:2,3-bisphosphoglycerate-independent phosphoglycerate mutase
LIVEDPQRAEDLDEAETVAPARILGQRLDRWIPKGSAGAFIQELMRTARGILENHDVNRVRIDLGENPASQIWLWGQGRAPKLKPFSEETGLEGACLADRRSWRGIAAAAGMKILKKWDEAQFADFNVIETAGKAGESSRDFKSKVRRIELFDANVVGKLAEWLEKTGTKARVIITSDLVQSTARGQNTHTHVPVLYWGQGMQGAESFNEKNCGLSGRLLDPGYAFVKEIVKG